MKVLEHSAWASVNHAPSRMMLSSAICLRRLSRDVVCALVCGSTLLAVPHQAPSQAERHANNASELFRQARFEEAEKQMRRAVELSPRNAQYLASLGAILAMQQKLPEAQVYFKDSLKLDPGNWSLRRDLAASQWQLGQLAEAQANLEQVLKTKPGDETTTLLLGMVLENLKDYANAARLLALVSAQVRQRPEAVAALARSYYKTGQREKARLALQSLDHHPAGAESTLLGGQVAAEAEDNEVAEKFFLSARKTHPERARVDYQIALLQYRSGRLAESEETLTQLIGSGHARGEVYSLLAKCHEKQGQPQKAIRAFEQAIEIEPTRETHFLDLAALLASQRALPAALSVASDAAKRHPNSAASLRVKGMIELRMSQYTDAVRSYDQARRLDPLNAETNRWLAVAQAEAGMTSEAISTFEDGLKQFPKDALHFQEYGKMLLKAAESGNQEVEARGAQLLSRALSLESTLPEPHYHLGQLALQKGKTQEALAHLNTAAKLDPRNSKVRFALSRAYRQLGQADEAAQQLRIYQELKASEEKVRLVPSTTTPRIPE